jgi:hypothetical protein
MKRANSYLFLVVTHLAGCSTLQKGCPVDFVKRNYDTVFKIYNTTIYPNNQAFLTGGHSAIPKGLFNANASGRITPFGNFSGNEDTAEYFFGLTPIPQLPLFDTWTEAKIAAFTSGCPEVASSVVYGTVTGVEADSPYFRKKITTIKQVWISD